MGILQDTIVVVPCFNEARRLDVDAFRDTLAAEPNLRFLFVDDGSADATRLILLDLANDLPARALFVGLDTNRGKAEAVRRGILEAWKLNPELVGYWDADLATPLALISRFAEVLHDSSLLLVLGSRVRLLGRTIERTPARHYVGRFFATAAALTLGLSVYDTQCGAKLFRATRVMREVFERPFALNWCFDVEMLARLIGLEQRGLCSVREQCVEVVLDTWVDSGGSKLDFRQIPHVMGELLRLGVIVRAERRNR